MDALFLAAILIAVAEGIAQYRWWPAYFTLGIPILVASVPEAVNGVPVLKQAVNLKLADHQRLLVRQLRYGIARYACFHGFVQLSSVASGTPARCFLFVDWNVLLVGAFIACSITTASLAAVLLGMALATAVSAAIVNSMRRRILHDCALSIAGPGSSLESCP
jgi:hypothetical protein